MNRSEVVELLTRKDISALSAEQLSALSEELIAQLSETLSARVEVLDRWFVAGASATAWIEPKVSAYEYVQVRMQYCVVVQLSDGSVHTEAMGFIFMNGQRHQVGKYMLIKYEQGWSYVGLVDDEYGEWEALVSPRRKTSN